MTPSLKPIFQSAVETTFARMFTLAVTPQAAPPAQVPDCFYVTGLTGFTGGVTGSVAVQMCDDTARLAACRMVGEARVTTPEMLDCVGEISNMVAGNAKANFTGKNISLTIPEVISGRGYQVGFRKYREKFELYYASEIGPITVMVALSDK